MELEFMPLDYGTFDVDGKNYVKIVGRSSTGKRVMVVDEYMANFYVVLREEHAKEAKEVAEKIATLKVEKTGRISEVNKTEILEKHFLGKKCKAIRVFVSNHKDAHDLASEIGDDERILARREYDIPLLTKYIKEKGLKPLCWYKVKGEIIAEGEYMGVADTFLGDISIKADSYTPIEKHAENYHPKALAFDIEASSMDASKGEALMISLYGKGMRKVLTWKDCKKRPEYLHVYENEEEMLKGFIDEVKEYSPDIIVGYFSDGFDLPFLVHRAKILGVPFELGLDGKAPVFNRAKIPSCNIQGIIHVDAYRFISSVFAPYLQSETLGLGDVAQELIGETKEDFDFSRLSHMSDKDWEDFFSYNLQDSAVTYKLFEKIWPDMEEFCKITQEPLFEVTRTRMAGHVEHYLLHNLDRFDEIAEKRPGPDEIGRRRALGKYEGAFVFEPVPGLYEHLVFFDFTSMYASVTVTYNLSLSTHLGNGEFSKKQGFFPELLAEIIEKRKKHKKEYAKEGTPYLKARSNAYKLLANASYGYQGFFGARYYCREAAAATARYARENIHKAIDLIRSEGYSIIYSDTDSIAFLQGEKSKKDVLDFLKNINDSLPGIMELDLEDFYKRGLFVSKRATAQGAKKKYALVDEKGKLKVRGFETVRRDWCWFARELQSRILEHILEEGNEKKALALVKQKIKELKERKVDLKDLLLKEQLRMDLGGYKAEGPHVAAAKKLKDRGVNVGAGSLIEYFVGEPKGKEKKIGDRVYLPDEGANYDTDYYLNNQVIPAVENILEVFGIKAIEIVDGKKQTSLKDF